MPVTITLPCVSLRLGDTFTIVATGTDTVAVIGANGVTTLRGLSVSTSCKHLKARIQPGDRIGSMTCHECGQTVMMYDVFNNLLEALHQEYEELQEAKTDLLKRVGKLHGKCGETGGET